MSDTSHKKAVIIGAGPAGLTAAFELLTKTNIKPIVVETTADIGGISKTVNYKGNRIDIGGHRFFSKSDIIMHWWQNIFPKEDASVPEKNPENTDKVLLIRSRQSRILFLRKFFDYPLTLSLKTIKNLGLRRLIRISFSYLVSMMIKRKPEKSLEDFFINRFGKELYKTFFKSYTEKVWGVPCSEISPQWGGQRIKGLSIRKAISHAIKETFKKKDDISQKKVETSLISRFLYPKHGPGQLWEEVTERIKAKGGEILMQHKAIGFEVSGNKVISCTVRNKIDNTEIKLTGDYFFSTMPICDLVSGLGEIVPPNLKRIASGLIYRDFITVGVLLDRVTIKDKNNSGPIMDNWIYIQERDVQVGRLQIFNNWSPYMVRDKSKTWVGMEYFCFEGDDMWNMPNDKFTELAIGELEKIGFCQKKDVLDSVVIKMPKAYPCYFGTYQELDKVTQYLDGFDNLFLIGRNGMHKYNNQDHSMLTAIVAVENIMNGKKSKENIWEINLEEDYHEEKKSPNT